MSAPSMPGRPPRGSALVLAALLTCALALGAAVDRVWLVRTGRVLPPGMPPLAPLARPTPAQEAELRTRLKAALGVTPAQAVTVDRIVSQQITMLERLRADVRPRLDSIFEVSRIALDSVLTPPQRARRDSLLRVVAPFVDSVGVSRH